MARSRGGHRGLSRGQRRSTSWETGPLSADTTVSSSTGKLWSATAVPQVDGLTVVRMRGLINIWLTAATAAGDGFAGAFGIGITSDEAIAIGVTAVPSPLSNMAWEGWIWHSFWDVRALTGTIADGVNAGVTYQRVVVDSKAMRKLPLGMTMFGASDQTESGTATAEYNADIRMLVKNP